MPGRLLAAALSHPDAVLALAGDRTPVERDGRVLNRGIQALLGLVAVLDRATNRGGGTPDPVSTREPVTPRPGWSCRRAPTST